MVLRTIESEPHSAAKVLLFDSPLEFHHRFVHREDDVGQHASLDDAPWFF